MRKDRDGQKMYRTHQCYGGRNHALTSRQNVGMSRPFGPRLAKGIPRERMFVDALVFPISVDSRFVVHCLDAFRHLRARYGEGIHLTGGLSNVSFGMPCRKLINEVFLNLAVEAGADSGIVDPVTSDLNRVFGADKSSRPYRLALEMLLGNDPGCVNYLEAYREGELEPQPA